MNRIWADRLAGQGESPDVQRNDGPTGNKPGVMRPGVRAELIDQLYKQTPIGMIATLVNSFVLVCILWKLGAHQRLLLWLGVTIAVTVCRYGLLSAYRTGSFKRMSKQGWGALQVAGLFASGLIWGSTGIFLFPGASTAHQTFIAFVLAGMVAGAVGMCSSVLAAFYAFSLPALLPISIRFVLLGDDLHMAMGVMSFIFLILTSVTAWRINVAATELVGLKQHFAEKVAERTNEWMRANDELRREIVDRKHAEARIRLALREKEVLLKEVHHRVKNNLAVIISILKMRSSRLIEPLAKEAIQDCYERVEAIALIHETLYQSEDLAAIPLAAYAHNLSTNLMQIMLTKEERSRVRVIIQADGVHLPIDAAIPCGLILNELLTNAFKYAFAHGKEGEIRVAAQTNAAGDFELSFRDNGAGFPAGLNLERCRTLGFRIISVLVKHQMEGTWEARNEDGASITIRWPSPAKETHNG